MVNPYTMILQSTWHEYHQHGIRFCRSQYQPRYQSHSQKGASVLFHFHFHRQSRSERGAASLYIWLWSFTHYWLYLMWREHVNLCVELCDMLLLLWIVKWYNTLCFIFILNLKTAFLLNSNEIIKKGEIPIIMN